jgi:hypothetical protein
MRCKKWIIAFLNKKNDTISTALIVGIILIFIGVIVTIFNTPNNKSLSASGSANDAVNKKIDSDNSHIPKSLVKIKNNKNNSTTIYNLSNSDLSIKLDDTHKSFAVTNRWLAEKSYYSDSVNSQPNPNSPGLKKVNSKTAKSNNTSGNIKSTLHFSTSQNQSNLKKHEANILPPNNTNPISDKKIAKDSQLNDKPTKQDTTKKIVQKNIVKEPEKNPVNKVRQPVIYYSGIFRTAKPDPLKLSVSSYDDEPEVTQTISNKIIKGYAANLCGVTFWTDCKNCDWSVSNGYNDHDFLYGVMIATDVPKYIPKDAIFWTAFAGKKQYFSIKNKEHNIYWDFSYNLEPGQTIIFHIGKKPFNEK